MRVDAGEHSLLQDDNITFYMFGKCSQKHSSSLSSHQVMKQCWVVMLHSMSAQVLHYHSRGDAAAVRVVQEWKKNQLNGRKLLSCNFLLVVTRGTGYWAELDTSVNVSSVGAETTEEVKAKLQRQLIAAFISLKDVGEFILSVWCERW